MNAKTFVANPLRASLLAFSVFFTFFLVLFAQFPLQGALSGNCDTLLAITISNTYLNKVAAFFGFGAAGMAMFPAGSVMYGEGAPLMGLLYVVFKLFGLNDINAYYLFLTLIFSLTAVGVFVFSSLFIRSFPARFFAGFAVACSNLMFTQIDDAPIWCYFFPLLSLTFLTRAIRERNTHWAYLSAMLGGAQIYFSMYIFVYQTILIAALLAYHLMWRQERLPWPVLVKGSILYTLLAAPLLSIYLWSLKNLSINSPWDARLLESRLSMHLSDFTMALPGNLLYGRDVPQSWYLMHHQNLIGVLVVVATVFALFRRGEHRLILVGMGLVGLLLALGPDLMAGGADASPISKLPLFHLYEWFPILHFLRVPIRAYFFVLLAVSILAGVTLQFFLERFPQPRAVAFTLLLFFGVHFIENVPFPFMAYKLGPYLEIPAEYKSFMTGKTKAVVLDLPTDFGFTFENWDYDLFSDPYAFIHASPGQPALLTKDIALMDFSEQTIFAYNRDMLYWNWQTQHKQNIIGGVNGYFPTSRLIFQRWIEDLPAEHALLWLQKQGVTYIAYHKEMLLPGEQELLSGLETSPLLRRVVNGERSEIFEFVTDAGRAPL